jgi:hypothetical protein
MMVLCTINSCYFRRSWWEVYFRAKIYDVKQSHFVGIQSIKLIISCVLYIIRFAIKESIENETRKMGRLQGQIIPSCVNHPSTHSTQIRKTSCNSPSEIPFRISVTASRRSFHWGAPVLSARFLLSLTDRSPMERYQENKVDAGASSAGCARKRFEPSLSCRRVHCQSALPTFFALHSSQREKFLNYGNQVSTDQPCCVEWSYRKKHYNNVEPMGIRENGERTFLDTAAMFSTSGVFSSPVVHILSRTYLS